MTRQFSKALRGALVALATLFALPAGAQQEDRYAFTQDYEPSPAVWELSDEDTSIYMLGTIHLLPEGFRWRNPQLDAIIDAAEVLVVETSDEDGENALEAMHPKLLNLLLNRTPTSQQLSPQARSRWRELVALSGMPFDYVDSIPVMVALLGLGQASLEGDPSSYDHGVETVLENEFRQSGRPIESIEDFGRVIYGLFRVDDAEVVAELDAKLRDWNGKSIDDLYADNSPQPTGDAYWAIEHAWAQGKVAEDFDLGFGNGKIGQAFHDVLLDRRNRQWAAWLEDRLQQPGTVLLAVGAGHFEGPDSLLAKLEERGLRAERVN